MSQGIAGHDMGELHGWVSPTVDRIKQLKYMWQRNTCPASRSPDNKNHKPRPVTVRRPRWWDKLRLLTDHPAKSTLRVSGISLATDLTYRQAAERTEVKASEKLGFYKCGRLHLKEDISDRAKNSDGFYDPSNTLSTQSSNMGGSRRAPEDTLQTSVSPDNDPIPAPTTQQTASVSNNCHKLTISTTTRKVDTRSVKGLQCVYTIPQSTRGEKGHFLTYWPLDGHSVDTHHTRHPPPAYNSHSRAPWHKQTKYNLLFLMSCLFGCLCIFLLVSLPTVIFSLRLLQTVPPNSENKILIDTCKHVNNTHT